MVEGVHFKLEWGTPESLGARSLTVNLSDIASMGGTPTACVVNLAVRAGLDGRFFDRLYSGLRKSARIAGVDIVGGNITRAGELAITIALFGDAGAAVLRRDTARPGDEIFVTGTIGDAAAGLLLLQGKAKGRRPSRDFLIGRFLNPSARLDAGRKLAGISPAAAAIDVSDGLRQDLGHILERSRVGAEIDIAAIPLSPAYRMIIGNSPELALSGGDDYELLFCTRAGLSEAHLSKRLRVQVRRIGRITRGRKLVLLEGGSVVSGSGFAGWDQLRGAPRPG
jgi:thiamine-monophosphate kinase